jgi:hypothetical protein
LARITLLTVLCTVMHTATPRAQSSGESESRTRLNVEFASEEMRRYPSIATALGQLANRAADVALDGVFGAPEGRGARAVAHRIVRTYLVGLPIAALSATAAHELGHVSRGHEGGLSFSGFRVAEWPWPVPVMSARLYVDTSGDAPSYVNELSAIAGGAEAARVQEDALLDTIYSGPTTNYFNWLLLADAKLEMPLYAWTDTGPPTPVGDPGQFADEFGFRRAVAQFRPNAPGLYFLATRTETTAAWHTLKQGMWLNLVDYSLAAAVVQTVNYVRTGGRETSVPALRRGSWAIVPALRFSITSQGFERAVDVRVIRHRTASHAALRWTDTPSGERLWAGGVELRAYRERGWQPQVRGDVFQRTADMFNGWSRDGVGARLEAGARWRFHAGGRPFDAGFRLGYKTRGYLIDAPERRTLLGGVTFGMTF